MKLTSYAKVSLAKLSFSRRKRDELSNEDYYLNTSNFSEVINEFNLFRKRITKDVNRLNSLKQKEKIKSFNFTAYSFYSVYFYVKDSTDLYQFEPIYYKPEDFASLDIRSTLRKVVEKTIKEVPTFYEIFFSFYLIYDSIKDNYDTDLKANLEMSIRIARDDPF